MPITAGPATNVKLQFTANGSATYSNLEQWIFAKEDISVYFDQGKQDPATYSISIPTSAGYDITFSSPPVAPITITILRRIVINDPENFSPGSSLTAEDLNTRFDAAYLIETDNKFYSENIEPTYGDVSLTYTPGSPQIPAAGDLNLPVLSTPAATDAPRVWAKDSTGAIIDAPLDPGGKTAAELETELAAATSPTASGANMIGYWNGTSAVTVQADLDTLKAKIEQLQSTFYQVGNVIALMPRGDAGPTGDTPIPPGYLWILNGQSIGPTGSGATSEGNKYKPLYLLMWRSIPSPYPGTESVGGWYIDGTPGASAEADWAAGKKLNMPPIEGAVVCQTGGGIYQSNSNPVFSTSPPYTTSIPYVSYAWAICYGIPS